MKKTGLVFLVDDDIDDQGLFLDALSEIDKNIQLVTAANGVEAVQKLASDIQLHPDYIFMDLNMPLMTGIQCLKELKKIPALAKIPVVIYSTSSYSKDLEEAKIAGAFDYIIKPFSFPELCEKIRKVLYPV
jgi:CheY-like chemotaxis protein